MLSGEQIKGKQLIQNDRPESYRAASYDLTVGTIIPPLARPSKKNAPPSIGPVDTFVMPPQGMVEVVSHERVKIPKSIAGYATVKTGLCDKGILALNIGIIDPCYEGLISSTLINFGKSDFNLKKGEVFLRLTFFEYAPPEVVRATSPKDDQYIKDKESKVLQHLSRTFLNLDQRVKELTEPILKEWTSGMLRYVGFGSLLLAGFAFLVTLGVSYVSRQLGPREQITQELTALVRQMQDSTNKRIDSIVGQIRVLRAPRDQGRARPQGATTEPAVRDSGQ
jgi:deoxycytidine triphosphate deaminase